MLAHKIHFDGFKKSKILIIHCNLPLYLRFLGYWYLKKIEIIVYISTALTIAQILKLNFCTSCIKIAYCDPTPHPHPIPFKTEQKGYHPPVCNLYVVILVIFYFFGGCRYVLKFSIFYSAQDFFVTEINFLFFICFL